MEGSMQQFIQMNLDDSEHLSLVCRALSIDTRISILQLLCNREMNINEIAESLSIPQSSAAAHVKVLEEANLIKTTLQPGIRGSMKVCSKSMDSIAIDLTSKIVGVERKEVIHMPIGNYVDYKVEPTCGIVSEKGSIGEEDEPRCFYHPERYKAKLLWLGKGYVEYRFPNNLLKYEKEEKLEISMELCSEDHEYNLDYPSDITLWVNGIDAGTYLCPSDFGGRRGKLNPEWWPDKNSQYGVLKTWSITKEGTYIDDELVSITKLKEYQLADSEYISVRIGIKEDAKHIGGINLFGDCFGDYAQHIKMVIYY